MVKLPTAEEITERWITGMLITPPIPCPYCGRRTRAEWRCQFCKKEWNKEDMEKRREMRKFFVSQYPKGILEKLRKRGVLNNSWLFGEYDF